MNYLPAIERIGRRAGLDVSILSTLRSLFERSVRDGVEEACTTTRLSNTALSCLKCHYSDMFVPRPRIAGLMLPQGDHEMRTLPVCILIVAWV